MSLIVITDTCNLCKTVLNTWQGPEENKANAVPSFTQCRVINCKGTVVRTTTQLAT